MLSLVGVAEKGGGGGGRVLNGIGRAVKRGRDVDASAGSLGVSRDRCKLAGGSGGVKYTKLRQGTFAGATWSRGRR
jgi:hypothetical protein